MHDHSHHITLFRNRFYLSLILTLPIFFFSPMVRSWLGLEAEVPFQTALLPLLATVIYLYGGWPFLTGLLHELRMRMPGMMTLIAMAISVAYFYSLFALLAGEGKSFFWELASLIVIMLLGHWIEAKSVMGASHALEDLARLIPATAHRLNEQNETEDIPTDKLQKNDRILIRPGEKIPADGTVLSGASGVNESLITGESAAVRKHAGDAVIGGSVNGEGSLSVRVGKTGKESYLSQVGDMVKEAQKRHSRTQDFANRAAAWLFYAASLAGAVTFAVWYAISGADEALERTVTVLIIACPHALGLAIPLVIALSTALSAKNGILIRDRRAFEAARNLDAAVFDKTGTLTEGHFGVRDIIVFETDENNLLTKSAAVEIHAEHPIAAAIVKKARDAKITLPQAEAFTALSGEGVKARVDGAWFYLGGAEFMHTLGHTIREEKLQHTEASDTLIYAATEHTILGAFTLADTIKEDARSALETLKAMGLETYLITGDSESAAQAVAQALPIDHVHAQVLPADKAEYIRRIKEHRQHVAMIGDGINDAPALAEADVGIAVGAGTDVAIESAGLILVKNRLSDVPRAIRFARATYRKMVQNLWWAAGYNILAIPLAAGVLAPVGIVVNPAVGAVMMSLSTVIVALNTQLLRRQLT